MENGNHQKTKIIKIIKSINKIVKNGYPKNSNNKKENKNIILAYRLNVSAILIQRQTFFKYYKINLKERKEKNSLKFEVSKFMVERWGKKTPGAFIREKAIFWHI